MDLEHKKKLLNDKVIACGFKTQIDYNNLHQDIMHEYKHNTRLSLSSVSYDLRLMSSHIHDTIQALFQDKCFVMLIIDRMSGDNNSLAYRLYHKLYENNPELTLSEWKAYSDELLILEYLKRGIADMNAEIWLNSPLGESYFLNYNDGGNEL